MSKRLHTESSENATPIEIYGDREKVWKRLSQALDDFIQFYPSNTYADSQTICGLEYFFTWYRNEKGDLCRVESVAVSDDLVNVMQDFCLYLDNYRSRNTAKGDNSKVFTYIDFGYNLRENTNNKELAKIYRRANLMVGDSGQEEEKPYAYLVYEELKKFISPRTIENPMNLRKYILALTLTPRLEMCLTKNFVAFALVRYYFEVIGDDLLFKLTMRGNEHFENKEPWKGIGTQIGAYFPPDSTGWENLMTL